MEWIERLIFAGEIRNEAVSTPHEYTIEQILAAEIHALQNIPRENDYEGAISLILERVHEEGGRLIT